MFAHCQPKPPGSHHLTGITLLMIIAFNHKMQLTNNNYTVVTSLLLQLSVKINSQLITLDM